MCNLVPHLAKRKYVVPQLVLGEQIGTKSRADMWRCKFCTNTPIFFSGDALQVQADPTCQYTKKELKNA
jgi:hypothetical protein